MWKFVWLGFLFFTIAMLAEFQGWQRVLPIGPPLANYYFSIVLGVPMVAMLVALANDVLCKNRIDTWTAFACVLLPILWIGMSALQIFGS